MKTKSVKSIKKKLWELVKQFIRKRDGPVCYTCGKGGLEGSNWQTGHFIPSSVGGAVLRYHPINLAIQCYFCNINAGGNGSIFCLKMLEKYGLEYVNKLRNMKPNMQFKADILFYENMIVLYKYGNEENIVKYLESLTV